MIKKTLVESIVINQSKSRGKQVKSSKKGIFGTILNAQKSVVVQNKKKEIDGLLAILKTDKNSSHIKEALNKLEKLLGNLSIDKQHKTKSVMKEMNNIYDLIKKIKLLLQDKKSDRVPISEKNGIDKSISKSNKHGDDNLKQSISYLINACIDIRQKLNKENRSDKDEPKNSGKSNKISDGSKDVAKLIKLQNKLKIIKPSNIDKNEENHKAISTKQKNVKAKMSKIFSAVKKTDNKTDVASINIQKKKTLKMQKPLNNVQKKVDASSKNSILSSADKNKALNEAKQQSGTSINIAKNINLNKDSTNTELKHHLNNVQNKKSSKEGSASVDIEKSSKIENGKVVDIKKIKTDGDVKIIKNTVSLDAHKNRENSNINNIAKINMPQENKKTALKSFISAKNFKIKGVKNEGFFKIGSNNNIEKIEIKDALGIKISENKDNADYKDAQKTVNTGFSAAINNTEQTTAKQHPYPINKVIEEISKLQNLQQPFNRTITIKVNPPYLGLIQIKVSMDKDKNVSTIISTKDKDVFNILNLNAGHMKEYLTNNGVKMQNMNILNNFSQNGEQQGSQKQFSFGSGNNQQGQNQRFSQNDEMEFLKTENLKNIAQVHQEGLNIIV